MKNLFKKPELEVIKINNTDVIATSGVGQGYGANGDNWNVTPTDGFWNN